MGQPRGYTEMRQVFTVAHVVLKYCTSENVTLVSHMIRPLFYYLKFIEKEQKKFRMEK